MKWSKLYETFYFKKETNTASDYFIESIMKGGKETNEEI